MTNTRTITVLAALAVCLLLSGCKTPEANVRQYGTAYRELIAANPPDVIEAAKLVVEDMKLILISSDDEQVIARTAEDKKVTITVQPEGENVSRVSVRVGTLGSEQTSLLILEKIKQML